MFKIFGNSKSGEVTDLVRIAIASASLAKGQPVNENSSSLKKLSKKITPSWLESLPKNVVADCEPAVLAAYVLVMESTVYVKSKGTREISELYVESARLVSQGVGFRAASGKYHQSNLKLLLLLAQQAQKAGLSFYEDLLDSSLLGGKKEVNITNILKTVDEMGGQGFVQVPIKSFAKHLHENGEQKPSHAGSVEGFIDIDGKKRKVGFQYGMFYELKEGETLVTVFQKSNIEDHLESVGVENMAISLADNLLENITSSAMAVSLTYALLCETTIDGLPDGPDDIEEFSLKCSDGLTLFDEGYMEALNKNLNRDDDFIGKFDDAINEPVNIFMSIRNEIYDESKKQELSYLIMRKIINKWNLL